ncbi:MAG: hypothetical protein C0467_25380 [Planctomycetaceae bacterium]|nr:hypothetical protein [Planctomycetaceae bacterium]
MGLARAGESFTSLLSAGCEMNWDGVAGLVGGIIGAVGVLYGTLKRERREDVHADTKAARDAAEIDREDDATALDQWRTYAKDRERQHNGDIARLEKKISDQQVEITDMIRRERDCLIAHAEARTELAHLRREVEAIRADVRRAIPTVNDTAEGK